VQDVEVVVRVGMGFFSHAAAGQLVAFEVDHVDPDGGTAWSVLVRGLARLIGPPPRPNSRRLPTPWSPSRATCSWSSARTSSPAVASTCDERTRFGPAMGRTPTALKRLLIPTRPRNTLLGFARRYGCERGEDPPTIARCQWRGLRT
jgi:hypothetical protein